MVEDLSISIGQPRKSSIATDDPLNAHPYRFPIVIEYRFRDCILSHIDFSLTFAAHFSALIASLKHFRQHYQHSMAQQRMG